MESTRENLPQRLYHFHTIGKDRPGTLIAAPLIEAAEEILRLRRQREELISYLNGISRQTAEMVKANSEQ